MDADGVLTDGSVIYNDKGEETKVFGVRDGLGIKLLMEAGVNVCIATGRRSEALHHRCRDLGIVHIFDGLKDKASILDLILNRTGVSAEEVAFIGDDLLDLPLVRRAAFGVAVANAVDELKEVADYVTSKNGGSGAVREVIECILKGNGKWQVLMERYLV